MHDESAAVGNVNAVSTERAIAPNLRERERVVAVARLEPWVPRRLSGFDTPKERIERAMKSFEHVLENLRIHESNIRPQCLNLGEFVLLCSARAIDPGDAVGVALLLQCGVVQLVTRAENAFEFDALATRRSQPELERLGDHEERLTRRLETASAHRLHVRRFTPAMKDEALAPESR